MTSISSIRSKIKKGSNFLTKAIEQGSGKNGNDSQVEPNPTMSFSVLFGMQFLTIFHYEELSLQAMAMEWAIPGNCPAVRHKCPRVLKDRKASDQMNP